MQKRWAFDYARIAVETLRHQPQEQMRFCSDDVRSVLETKLAKEPGCWAVSWTDMWTHIVLWRSLHWLNLSNYNFTVPKQLKEGNGWGLRCVFRLNSNWAALEEEIRTKVFYCLRHLARATRTVAEPTRCCHRCDELAWSKSAQLCSCGEDAEWFDFGWIKEGCLTFLLQSNVDSASPKDKLVNWQDMRQFLPLFVNWHCHYNWNSEWLHVARVGGDRLLLGVRSQTQARRFMADPTDSLHGRTALRLIRSDASAAQRLAAGSAFGELLQVQIEVSKLPSTKERY
jgi:hypothetical protein